MREPDAAAPVGEPGDDAPTIADAPASARRADASGQRDAVSVPPESQTSGGTGSRATSVITPRETLHLQEIARTRVFVRLTCAFALFVTATLFVLHGSPVAKGVFFGGLGAAFAACAWLWWLLREDSGYTIARATFAGYVCMFTAFTGIYYFGVYSPAPVIVPFGLCFFSIGQSERAVFAVYLTCAIAQLALTLFVTAGVLPDLGIIRADALGTVDKVVVLALVEATFGATFLISRATRNATLYAIERHDEVVRSLAQRDALLREARHDLAQAMQAGGLGRFTGETVGSFHVGRVIGRGAMGEVYEATHPATGEIAAIKLLHGHVLVQADLVQRFFRESKIVSALNVANVVRVLEVAPPDARLPYIAMERLQGQDLADHLREHKRLSVRRVLTMLRQVGIGLDAARAAGVVHRDLKPRNLFLANDGLRQVWKILDFGVSKLMNDEGAPTLTRDALVGTPSYMAPEQAKGDAVSHRTDLFALAVIAYRALTGQPAFDGEMTAEILYKVVHTMPPRPSELAPLPAEVDLVFAIALAKDPGDRFDSAADFAQALDAASRERIEPELRVRAEKLLAKLPWGGDE
jgi:serine/threonine-protein kinase